MGMAASQARLLSITARIHDVEYQAQSIQNAKVQLATQQDAVYQDYLEALDATTLTIKTANAKVPATFNNLCSHNKLDIASLKESYAIRDKYGRLIVEDAVAQKYKNFNAEHYANTSKGISAPQAFALYMLGVNNTENENNVDNLRHAEGDAFNVLVQNNPRLKALKESILETLGWDKDEDYTKIYNISNLNQLKAENSDKYQSTKDDYESKLTRFLYELYNARQTDDKGDILYGAQLIYENAQNDQNAYAEDVDMNLFNYYVNIYNQIQQCGDCISINEFNGILGGNAAEDSDWLKSMVESGQFTIELVNDNRDGTISMNGTGPSSDSRISYTTTTEIDNKALKKAEAKYEKDLKDIDRKDKAYDMTLSKLETQRSALTTEYESVQKVIEDNIERTFGIFS